MVFLHPCMSTTPHARVDDSPDSSFFSVTGVLRYVPMATMLPADRHRQLHARKSKREKAERREAARPRCVPASVVPAKGGYGQSSAAAGAAAARGVSGAEASPAEESRQASAGGGKRPVLNDSVVGRGHEKNSCTTNRQEERGLLTERAVFLPSSCSGPRKKNKAMLTVKRESQ
jgi:hypothetical protein